MRVLVELRDALNEGDYATAQTLLDDVSHLIETTEERADELEKACCDVYNYIKHHDINAAKIRLLTTGALPDVPH